MRWLLLGMKCQLCDVHYFWTTNTVTINSHKNRKIKWNSWKFQFYVMMNSLKMHLTSIYRRNIEGLFGFLSIFFTYHFFGCVCLSNSQSGKNDHSFRLQWSWAQYTNIPCEACLSSLSQLLGPVHTTNSNKSISQSSFLLKWIENLFNLNKII